MHFEFATATRIIFGPGSIKEAAPIAASFGRRALVVAGSTSDRVAEAIEQLRPYHIEPFVFFVSNEPLLEDVQHGVDFARDVGCDVVIGLGGGSALDTGKAIAALITNIGDPLDYLEVIGRGLALSETPLPYLAIPTTAGTGSEVTRNAVLASHEHHVKVSLRSPLMLPRVAIVDPELTHSLPPAITASTGLDALTQLIEPYTCNLPNPLVDAICCDGMQRAARSLKRAYQNGSDAAAREDMSLAALFGGLALANARLGAVHGFAGPFGGLFPAPHGMICARLLPFVVEANMRALQTRDPNSPVLRRYGEVAQFLTGRSTAGASDMIEWLHQVCADLDVAPLSQFGFTLDDIPVVVAQAQKASSMKGNPIVLTEEELTRILSQAI
ncbi:MAG TPA: iron-containing alcohol dehydrogenase [Anaerolineae bacterium]|nr:iron-containing alcohol dehydrogenase [Anaerolineae bacterium]